MKNLLNSLLLIFFCISCATTPYDYTQLKQYKPRSILVLPPLNQSTDLKGSYSCLSSVTRPLAELGYYVYPAVVIDEFLKGNGMPTSGEMHQVSLKKIEEIINPDAVMYITVEDYGTTFQLFISTSQVTLKAKLIHTKTGTLLWSGTSKVARSSDPKEGIAGAVFSQVIHTSVDQSRQLCKSANWALFSSEQKGLLLGPLHPKYQVKEN